jgi:Flp pilus assembly secretin CpaC
MNTPVTPRRPFRWLRFTLGQLFVLTLGIVIGFAPFRLHEAFAPPSKQVRLDIKIIEIPRDEISRLGLPAGFQENGWQEVDEEIPSQWRAAQIAGVLRVLSEPTLTTLDDQRAIFSVHQQVPATNGSTNEIGTEFFVHPKLLRNGRIRLNLAPTINSLEGTGAKAALKTETFDFMTELADGNAIVFRSYSRGEPKPQDFLIYVRATSAK